MMNFRALQFTKYMDYEIEKVGYKKQTKVHKEQILIALGLANDGWDKWAEG